MVALRHNLGPSMTRVAIADTGRRPRIPGSAMTDKLHHPGLLACRPRRFGRDNCFPHWLTKISYSVGVYPHWHPCAMACKALLTSLQFAGRRTFFWTSSATGILSTTHDLSQRLRVKLKHGTRTKYPLPSRCRRTRSGRYNPWQTLSGKDTETPRRRSHTCFPSLLPTVFFGSPAPHTCFGN